MRSCVRFSFLALLVGALVVVSAPAAVGAEAPAIEKFVATNCTVATCGQEDVLGPFFERGSAPPGVAPSPPPA